MHNREEKRFGPLSHKIDDLGWWYMTHKETEKIPKFEKRHEAGRIMKVEKDFPNEKLAM